MRLGRFVSAVLLILILCGISFVACDEGGDDDDADDDFAGDDDDSADDDDEDPDPFYPPQDRGPYEVGQTTMCFVDESRYEIWGGTYRFMPLEIWYPSTGTGGAVNTLPDTIGPLPPWAWGLMELVYGEQWEILLQYQTDSLRDAEVSLDEAPYPVVFFSHGLNAIRFQNFTMCEHLASHGFIVVASDHYGNAIFTNDPFSDALILVNPVSAVTSYWDEVQDVEFIYNELQKLNAEGEAPWQGLFNLEDFGMTGHSYGGLNTLHAGAELEFIDAIAPLNGAWIGKFPEDFNKPFFMLQGQMDGIVELFDNPLWELWEDAESEYKIHIDMFRGGHYSATDACLLLPPGLIPDSKTGCSGDEFIPGELAIKIVNGYMTAFFKVLLAGDERYEDFLLGNWYPLETNITVEWPE